MHHDDRHYSLRGAAQDSRNVSLNIELVLNACSAFYNNDGSEKMVKVGKAGLLCIYSRPQQSGEQRIKERERERHTKRERELRGTYSITT